VGLLPAVNSNRTQDNVRNFLTDEFPRFIVKSGYSQLEVQSPRISDLPKSQIVGNSAEDGMVDYFESNRIVLAVVKAIDRCPKPYSKILRMAYIEEMNDTDIIVTVPYERSQFYRLKAKAFLWFADTFEDTCDLHIYAKENV